KVRVPQQPDDRRGAIEFDGFFSLGQGKYHVDWMMRENGGRVCASSWDIEARFGPKELAMKAWTGTGLVQPAERDPFREEVPIARDKDLVNLDILVNVGPRDASAAALDPHDLQNVTETLRQIARDPKIASYSLLVCSIPAHKVLNEQPGVDQI